VFDVVIANPPYSIKEFKNTINGNKDSFYLYNSITDKNENIECLFVERAKQLLVDGGVAGIILPVSFLTSSENINVQTRFLLFQNFNIKACVYLGEKTFMKTNVYSSILFLEKKDVHNYNKIKNIIDNFFKDFKDCTCNGIDSAFSKYINYVYKNLTLEEYSNFINYPMDNSNNKISDNEICNEYLEENLSEENIIELEKEKLLYFIISYNQKVIIVNSGTGNNELDFLGYEFRDRRNNKGIKIKTNEDGDFKTKLFNNKNIFDETKVNSYILNSFINKFPDTIHDKLQDNVEVVNLYELFDFYNSTFNNTIRYGIQKTKFINKKTVKLKYFFESINGVIYKKSDQERIKTSKRILTSTHISLKVDGYTCEKPIYLREELVLSDKSKLKKNDLFISTSNSLKHLGKVALIDKDLEYWCGGFCTILRLKENYKNEENISIYVKKILQESNEFKHFVNLYKNSRISNIGKDLMNFRIPFPKEL
jgi:type I restriction enzyme M protein